MMTSLQGKWQEKNYISISINQHMKNRLVQANLQEYYMAFKTNLNGVLQQGYLEPIQFVSPFTKTQVC